MPLHRGGRHSCIQRTADLRSGTAGAISGHDARLQEAESDVGGGMDAGGIRHIFRRVRPSRRCWSDAFRLVAGSTAWQSVGGYLRACRPAIFQLHGSADRRQRNSGMERKRRNPADSLRHVGIEFGGLDSRVDGTRESSVEHARAWAPRQSKRSKGFSIETQTQARDGAAEARTQRPDHPSWRCSQRAGSAAIANCRRFCAKAPLTPASPRGCHFQHHGFHVDSRRLDTSWSRICG